jgi:hypothetical protein
MAVTFFTRLAVGLIFLAQEIFKYIDPNMGLTLSAPDLFWLHAAGTRGLVLPVQLEFWRSPCCLYVTGSDVFPEIPARLNQQVGPPPRGGQPVRLCKRAPLCHLQK